MLLVIDKCTCIYESITILDNSPSIKKIIFEFSCIGARTFFINTSPSHSSKTLSLTILKFTKIFIFFCYR